VLGTYALQRLLGEGAMGRVWLGRHTKLGRNAAIKVLKSEHTQNSELVGRFFDEARAVNQINHEHIVAIADFVEELEPPRVYCIMEYLPGESLERRLGNGPMPLKDALSVMRQVCDALGAAHQLGIVHRDVKPDNIFIMAKADGSPFAKVLDFGVAKLTPAMKRDAVTTTQSGQLIGTPSYMAPEQIVGLEVDAKADVYSAGTVLYRLLAGRLPFTQTDVGALSLAVIKQPPPELPSKAPCGEKISLQIARVVNAALAKEPERRPDMAQIVEVLERELRGEQPGRGLPVVPVAVAAAMVVAAGAWLALRPKELAPAPPPVVVTRTAPASKTVKLTVRSEPPGASVTRDDGTVLGTTPLTSELARGTPAKLRIALDGYLPLERGVAADSDSVIDVALAPKPPEPVKPPAKKRPRITEDGTLDPFKR